MLSNRIDHTDITVGKKLGEGLTSQVYLGFWNTMRVAIKMPINDDPLIIDLFNKEKEIMERLASCSTGKFYEIKFYGFIEHKIAPALVVEYMPNGDLIDLLQFSNPTESTLHKIALDVAYGLKFLHENKILHCDVKPDNIMINENGQAKLIDFGFSILKDQIMYILKGTPAFLAPELVQDDEEKRPIRYSEKSDIFAYSMMLFVLYTRTPPYSESLSNSQIFNLVMDEWTRPPVPTTVPHGVSKLITWGWMANPSSRPSDETVVNELEEIIRIDQPRASKC